MQLGPEQVTEGTEKSYEKSIRGISDDGCQSGGTGCGEYRNHRVESHAETCRGEKGDHRRAETADYPDGCSGKRRRYVHVEGQTGQELDLREDSLRCDEERAT